MNAYDHLHGGTTVQLDTGSCIHCHKYSATLHAGSCIVCRAGGIPELESVTSEADRIVSSDRDDQHGPWEYNASTAARIAWALDLDAAEPDDWPLMLVALKLSRLRHDPTNRDNYVDAIGYLQLAWEARE